MTYLARNTVKATKNLNTVVPGILINLFKSAPIKVPTNYVNFL